ncbi:MAG: response regulator [Bacillaceae bacterium]
MHKVVIADDFQIIRTGLRIILESSSDFDIIGEAVDGNELLSILEEVEPDLVISDLIMPGPSIIESCKMIKEKHPNVKIIVLTAFDESEDIYNAVDAGIDGYIMKDTKPEQMLKILDTVMNGYSIFQPKVTVNAHKKKEKKAIVNNIFDFTEREEQVFQLIVENYSNQHIAKKLYISEATVKTHVSNILKKTGQPNRSQAVIHAINLGYIES